MKKKIKIKYLESENADLKEQLKQNQTLINQLFDEQEEMEKKIQFLLGEEHAYEVVHTGRIC